MPGVCVGRLEFVAAGTRLLFWYSLRIGLCLLLLMLCAVFFIGRYANLGGSLEECCPKLVKK